jgi:uncharacterized membrane protein YcjF (UPF0283 family)
MLFASSDGSVFLFLIVVAAVVAVVVKCLIALAKAQEMAELKKRSPEAWARIKQMEHEKEMMARQAELQQKERRHRTGMTVFSILGRIFLK